MKSKYLKTINAVKNLKNATQGQILANQLKEIYGGGLDNSKGIIMLGIIIGDETEGV